MKRRAGTLGLIFLSVLVTRFSENTLGEVRAAVKRFENNGIKLNGAILNAVERRATSYYRYEKYGYGNYQYNYISDKQGS